MQTNTESSSPSQHVAVLAFPFTSHTGNAFRLARRLAAAAPDVTFSFCSTAAANQSLFTAVPDLENLKAFDVPDGVPEGSVLSGNVDENISLFLEVAQEGFKAGIRAAEAEIGRRISCLIGDSVLWFAGEMAGEMGVPWVALWTSGSRSLTTHFYTDLIRETVGINDLAGRENEIATFIPGFSALRLGDLPSEVLFGNIESRFSASLQKMGHVMHRAAAVLVNSFEGLEPETNENLTSKFQKFLNVGPLNLSSPLPSSNSDEYGCLQWLDKQKPASVAYVGFGTLAVLAPNELVALAEALEASDIPFLWSLKDNFTKHLPEGLQERMNKMGRVVPWTPQVQVLAHTSIGVYITHCGWNSVLESIAAGVPLIGRPLFADQQLNAWTSEHIWKIGVRVEGVLTKSKMVHALELVLSSKEGKKFKEQIGHLKELAFEAVGPNGSSTQNFNTLMEVVTGHQIKSRK